MTRIDTAEVRDAISVESVLDRYGLQARRRGSQYRLTLCPRCGAKSNREAIAIDARTGRWCHHGHERPAGGMCSGDILDLIAACEGLDCTKDFRRVAERAADIAGLTTVSDVERDLRQAQLRERARQQIIAELERATAARSTAGDIWQRHQVRCERGETYLRQRSLDPVTLVARGVVRFSPQGPVVAIRDADGHPISTATRRYDNTPKVMALKDHSTRGTMIDALQDITHSKPVVLVEGVVDALTARLAWPEAVILGANGAGNMPKIAEQAIVRIKLAQARLLIVPHDDEPGIRAATHAGRIAIAAGIELEDQLVIVGLPQKDLNDAWSQGWRP